jgi:tetratricopeptide (TPR) repeat protein
VAIHEKIGKESIKWANILNNIGVVYDKQDKLELALEYYLRAVTTHEKIVKESTDWDRTLINIENVKKKRSLYKKVTSFFSRFL